jgi:hypothetical protein
LILAEVTIPAKLCKCDVCGHEWTHAGKLPTNCHNRQCRSREWNGKKRRSRAEEIKLPAPRTGGRPKTKPFFDYSEDP